MQKQCKNCGMGMLFVQRMTRQYCNQACKQQAYRKNLKAWNLAQEGNSAQALEQAKANMDAFMLELKKRP